MKQQIPMPAIIGAAVVVLGLIGFFVFRTFADDGHGTVSSADVANHRKQQAQSMQTNMQQSAARSRSRMRPGFGPGPGGPGGGSSQQQQMMRGGGGGGQ